MCVTPHPSTSLVASNIPKRKKLKLWQPASLRWQSELWAVRNNCQVGKLAIELAFPRFEAQGWDKTPLTSYPPRVAYWLIYHLDRTPRVEADHPHAVRVTLHGNGMQPCLFGYFNGHDSHGGAVLAGLKAYHSKLRRQAMREQHRQRNREAYFWMLNEAVGMPPLPYRLGKR